MARAPLPGHCKTRLAEQVGDEVAAELCRVMLLDTLARIHQVSMTTTSTSATTGQTRLVVMAAPENDGVAALRALAPHPWEVIAQEGEGLGARLANAFVMLGGSGMGMGTGEMGVVALVDADSPTAPWEDAVRMLMLGELCSPPPRRVCMGPCEDGGYWLIAMATTPPLPLGILDDIAWSTKVVAAQTRDRCHALSISLEELATAYDVDVPRDIERLRTELQSHPERAPATARFLLSLGGDHDKQ